MRSQLKVRDGVVLHVFIRHEGFDQFGNALPDDGSAFPGNRSVKKSGQEDKKYASSAFERHSDLKDAGMPSSSSDEEVDYHNDDEEKVAHVKNHRFTIDFVARYPDELDNLVLHWGLSRKNEGAWGSPDPSFMPPNS